MFLSRRMWKLIHDQHRCINDQRAEMDRRQLEYARNVRDLIEQFFLVQEEGHDVREKLLSGLRDLRDEVARMEEHS